MAKLQKGHPLHIPRLSDIQGKISSRHSNVGQLLFTQDATYFCLYFRQVAG